MATVSLAGVAVFAEKPFRYRKYQLESSVEAVVAISGTHLRKDWGIYTRKGVDTNTATSQPLARNVQELEWRPEYVPADTKHADPVRDVKFRFYDDLLYQVVVTYDRDRVAGLTNGDVIQAIAKAYGAPLPRVAWTARGALPTDVPRDATIIAQWGDQTSLVTLTRGTYTPKLQLVLISRTLDAKARSAIIDPLRLDEDEASQQDLRDDSEEAPTTAAEREARRLINKAAFKP